MRRLIIRFAHWLELRALSKDPESPYSRKEPMLPHVTITWDHPRPSHTTGGAVISEFWLDDE